MSYSKIAACLGASYFVGRTLYAYGYTSGGPNKRIGGAAVSHLSAGLIVTTALVSALKIALKKWNII